MFHATLKSLLSRKLRLTLSAMAVVLGVMFVTGAFVLTDTLGKSFDTMFQSINKNVDVQVTGKPKIGSGHGGDAVPANIPADVVDKVKAVPGVQKATAGVYAQGARVIGKNGKVLTSFGPPQAGTGWNGTGDLIQLRQGRGPQAPDEIAMDAATAKSAKYKVGDSVGVLTLQPKKTFTLVGIFGYSGNRETLGGSQTVAFTMPVAQELLLGEKNVYTEVNLVADKGVSQTKLRDDVKSVLGGDYNVKTQKEVNDAQSADIRQGLKFFNYILLGFAGVALFVGIFLILNTFSMLVAQRTRELALFRAIGASRRQVVNSVLLEATAIGLVASVVGLLAGIGVGAGLAAAFSGFFKSNLSLSIGVPPTAVIAAFAVGLGITLIAALFPAVRASRIPPVAAMRDAATPDKPLTTITVAGAGVFAVGAAMLGWSLAGNAGGSTLWLILGGVLVTFVGVALLTPIISRPVVSLLGRLLSWSVPGKLGRRNSSRNPRRTAITAAALMVSIALVTGVSTILASATKSIGEQVSSQLKAELIVSGQQTSAIPPTFDEAVVAKTEKIPGVKTVATRYFEMAVIRGKPTFAIAINDLGATSDVLGLRAKSGNLSSLGDHDVVIDEKTAKDQKLSVGSTVPVQFTRGEKQTFTVAGIYKRSDAVNGYMFPQSAAANFRFHQPTTAFIQLDPGTSTSRVQSQVDTLLKDSPEVSVQDRSEFVKQTTAPFDFVLKTIQILLALAIIIAVLGIINTLALSVIERTRELGLLRAIGLRRSQTMRMITVESVVISVFGAILGLVVGVGLGAAVVQALKDQGFSHLALPWSQMITYLVLSAIIGVVAAVIPAIRAAKLNVLNAIAYE